MNFKIMKQSILFIFLTLNNNSNYSMLQSRLMHSFRVSILSFFNIFETISYYKKLQGL